MQGLEVISQTPIMDTPEYIYNILVFSIIFLTTSVLAERFVSNKIKKRLDAAMGVVIFISIIFEVMYITGAYREPTGEYTYKVKVAENVGYKTLIEDFNIISIDGDIYTIENK